MANANQADFLGEGGNLPSSTSNVKRPKERATDPAGLYYLDTGEPTPLAIRRQQAMRGEITSRDFTDTAFVPTGPNADQYKFDAQRGQYYTETGGRRVYITNDPAREQRAQETPIYTANFGPDQSQGYANTFYNAAALGSAGAAAGPYGAAIGAAAGALAGLPQASGRNIYLTAGSGEVAGRQATAAEAAQANANFAATGNSGRPAPGTSQQPAGGYQPLATYTPTMGTSGGSALSSDAQRILNQAGQFATQNTAAAARAGASASAAATRAAPQITAPSSANQQAVYDRAMSFQAQSGADAIRAAQADVSGAGRLESMQLDQQGIQNLEGFRSTNSEQGVNALYGYNPDATYRSANELSNFYAQNTAEGASRVGAFNPDMVQQDAESLRNFRADRSGIDRLNAYAEAPEGPSQAQALLRLQSDADKRTMLSIARSGRGGAGAAVNAQRQAITEGGLISAETRGQAAALRAQETDTYKQRQLAALAQAGSLISQAEAQRLQGLAQAGALMSQADQQKLQALMAYGELKATQDQQQLQGRIAGGQLNASADTNRLGAISNAAQLQGQMDAQKLAATSNAAQLRTEGDRIRSSNLQAAGQIRLQGSEINQRGAIAASQADLQAQALNLQSLSLAGNISTAIRDQDINVLRANLDASLQTMGLNDQQVRFFSQMQNDREVASQNLQMQANALGIDANRAQQALDLQWQQLMASQLNQQQQMQYQYDVLNSGNAQAAQQMAFNQGVQSYNQNRQDRNDLLQGIGSAFTALSTLFPTSQAMSTTQRSNSATSNVSTGPTGTSFRI